MMIKVAHERSHVTLSYRPLMFVSTVSETVTMCAARSTIPATSRSPWRLPFSAASRRRQVST
eukprot:5658005-Pleurochrysis_carterae.AAC.3